MYEVDRWDKTRRMAAELQEMKASDKDGMDRSNMESTRGILVYEAITYRDINLYSKGLHLNLDI